MQKPDFDPSTFGLPEAPELRLELADPSATRRLGAALADVLGRGDFIGLVGQLGAGKTTLVQGMVEALDPSQSATSPTYTLLHEYQTSPPIIHIDLYRLETYDELESIGYWDYVESGAAISCVEWVDQVPEAWPSNSDSVLIRLVRADGARVAEVFWPSTLDRDELAEALRAVVS
ncbi:MAG: tRNA (adenosine(37)-N6)-threonylcarbamoyltransferase complex ATPase subunit type 1 TsaE [Myxococcota bacterium]